MMDGNRALLPFVASNKVEWFRQNCLQRSGQEPAGGPPWRAKSGAADNGQQTTTS